MVCSIFIASITASICPLLTWSPALTAKDSTLPGMGAVSRPTSACASPAWANRSMARICVAPRALNTWSFSPSAYTDTSRRWPAKSRSMPRGVAKKVSMPEKLSTVRLSAPSCR